MEQCLDDYLSSLAGIKKDTIDINKQIGIHSLALMKTNEEIRLAAGDAMFKVHKKSQTCYLLITIYQFSNITI